MPDIRIDAASIRERVASCRPVDPDLTEVDVRDNFVFPLFTALGWNTLDPLVWSQQAFARGVSYADAVLQIEAAPVIFVAVKRFRGVTLRQKEASWRRALHCEESILSQAERIERGIDRTFEEKLALRRARAAGAPWMALTNFERLLLFDADEERIVLAFDAPEEYLARPGALKLLAPAETSEQFNSQLQRYVNRQEVPEIDRNFYHFLSDWRLQLAQAIYDEHKARPSDSPLHGTDEFDGELALGNLRQAVQRTIDRLIIIRYADDVGFLDQRDLLESQLAAFLNRRVYAAEYEFQQDLNRLYAAFYRRHDTTIFAPGHICEKVRIPNDTLVELTRAVSNISFRKFIKPFTGDILGNTYESYLGQRLVLEDAAIQIESECSSRKRGGVYYTPSHIVRYIVDHTLGRWLYGTENGLPTGERLSGASRKTLDDLDGLRVLDPAVGSGSFLIYAFEVLADFYESAHIRRDKTAHTHAKGNGMPEQTSPDYISRILQEHLYGVDLDPEAVEIASVNLILRAFDRLKDRGERRKLPLILKQNLKVGDSLIGGVAGPDDLASFEEERRRLIALREELSALEEDAARVRKLEQIKAIAAPVNAALNKSLSICFNDTASKRPFNWEIAFPEAFDPHSPQEKQGFTIVVGNPPYIFGELIPADEKPYFETCYETARGQYDLYWLFYERCLKLIRQNGYHGYIAPDALTVRDEAALVREKLVRGGTLTRIASVGAVFPDSDVSAVVTIWQKSRRKPQRVAIDYMRGGDLDWTDELEQQVFSAESGYRFSILIPPVLRSAFTKMQTHSRPLSEHVEISRGEELGKKSLLPILDPTSRPGHTPILVGGDIDRLSCPQPTYAIAREQIRKPDTIYRSTKILVVKTGSQIVATLDTAGHYTLQSLYNLSLKAEIELDPRFLLAVMVSTSVEVYFRKTFTEYKEIFPQINQSQLGQIPIPRLDMTDPDSALIHDRLVELTQRMLDLNEILQAVTSAFVESLHAHERCRVSLRDFLNEQQGFIVQRAALDADAASTEKGEINDIAVDEWDGGLLVRVKVADMWQDAVRLEIADKGGGQDLQLYLLLALRTFLYEKRRKRIWSRGEILDGVLKVLEVPLLEAATPAERRHHMAQLLDEARRLLPSDLPHHGVGLDYRGAPFHLSAIETDLVAAEAEIDHWVYRLYDLSAEEQRIILAQN